MVDFGERRGAPTPAVNPIAVDQPLSIEELNQPGLTAKAIFDNFNKNGIPVTMDEAQGILNKERARAVPADRSSRSFLPTNETPSAVPRDMGGGSSTLTNASSHASIEEQIRIEAADAAIRKAREEAFTKELLGNASNTQEGIGFSAGNSSGKSSSGGYGIGVGSGAGSASYTNRLTGQFKNNPLDAYASYTYHLKLWMTSQDNEIAIQDIVTGSNDTKLAIDNIPKVIIAESGVTEGFGIKEFNFVNLVGTNQETRNTQDLTWSMVIMEPYGLSLPDKINSAAQEYGMLNWHRAKYYLQLYFVGYNEDGSPVETAMFHKTFSLMITSISLTASEAGSVYDLKGIMDGGYGFSDEAAILKCTVKLTNKSTIGDIMNNLATALTNNQAKIESSNIPSTTFEIKLPNYMKSWQIDSGTVYKNDSRSWSMDLQDKNMPVLTLNSGKDISEVIRYIIGRSPQSIDWALGKGAQGSGNFDSHAIIKNSKVYSQVAYTGFDAWTGDYIKKITYTVYQYEETRSQANIAQVKKSSEPKIQQSKIDYLLGIGRIQKRYDWIFTGQNLDVIKFDLKINNFWAIAVPQYGAQNYNSNFSTGPLQTGDETSVFIRNKTRQLEDANKRLAAAQTAKNKADEKLSNDTGFWSNVGRALILSAAAESGNGQVYNAIQQQLDDEINTARSQVQEIKNVLQASQRETETIRNQFVVYFTQNPASLANSDNPLIKNLVTQRAKLAAAGTIFAEDQPIIAMNPEFPITIKYLPEANMAEGNQGAATASSVGNAPGQGPASRSVQESYHAGLNSFNKDNINIMIDVRGDPYWIGYDNLTQNIQVSDPSYPHGDFADYLGGDNMFFFNYRTGSTINEQTGLMQFDNTNQTISGYYIVMRVINTFREGSFTQQLQSIKCIYTQFADNPDAKKTPKTDTKSAVEQFVPVSNPIVDSRPLTPGATPLSVRDLKNLGKAPGAPLSRAEREAVSLGLGVR